MQEKQKELLSEIVAKVNDLFEGDLTDDDRLIYVNNVLKGKLLESETLVEQAANNTKEQFAASPDLAKELLNAIMDALEAHTSMSNQALNSERVREGLKDVLLGPGQLYEALRERSQRPPGGLTISLPHNSSPEAACPLLAIFGNMSMRWIPRGFRVIVTATVFVLQQTERRGCRTLIAYSRGRAPCFCSALPRKGRKH